MNDPEVIEVYTTAKSSVREIPYKIAEKLIIRIYMMQCAYTETDITNCKVADFDGSSVSLDDGWRLEVTNHKYYWTVGKILKL